ncbi:hypothetical protein [Persicitalea jodogahamensis]|uniref:Extracellular endo-alpha-(1->5)-L-arabinanase C-terminal domain-containing protein n=1 Tax=Persicitalea jodogahamensis TaxID=402147 RepID=A0A8J3D2Y5_9BACT|nr:hypothetical protein [Persicitalea jodogahamensis]GHB62255.1 hypothetical protein GCM10007390_15050 [Persicitalea jodogahamensis]
MKKLNLFLIIAFLLIGSGPLVAQSNTDLTGPWVLDVKTDMGSGTPTFDLKQDAEGKITGTYEGQLGETELKGSIKDETFHIEFSVQGNLVQYDGKVDNGVISGKVEIGTAATGTFTGKRKEQ